MSKKTSTILFIMQALGLAVLHFVTTFFIGFTTGIGSGGPFLNIINTILTFPLSVINLSPSEPAWLGWGAWVGLSLIWGFGVAYLLRRLTRSRAN
jgi:hypothetical protein